MKAKITLISTTCGENVEFSLRVEYSACHGESLFFRIFFVCTETLVTKIKPLTRQSCDSRSDLLTTLLFSCQISSAPPPTHTLFACCSKTSLLFKAVALIWLHAEDCGGHESVSERLMYRTDLITH